MSLRIWASLKAKVQAIKKWRASKATDTAAFRDAIEATWGFADEEGEHNVHAWK